MYYSKKWGKRQRIVHTYGEEDGSTDEEERRTEIEQHLRDGTARHCIPGGNTVDQPDNMDIVLGQPAKKVCKCGSVTHQRISHSDCPLNPKQTN